MDGLPCNNWISEQIAVGFRSLNYNVPFLGYHESKVLVIYWSKFYNGVQNTQRAIVSAVLLMLC